MSPHVSIITPCLNRAAYIEEAIQSVLRQDYPDVEHIIVDGGSTDGTLEILSRYPHLKVISEPDRGMYDALNKGLDLAQGEIVGFLNTDDLYSPGIFHEVARQFADQDLDAVAGHAVFFEINENGRRIDKMRLSSSPPEGLYKQIMLSGCLMNAWFFRRELCLKVGKFDPKYKIVGDADFMIRLRLRNFKYKLLDHLIYQYRSHADSFTMNLNEKKLQKILNDSGLLAENFLHDAQTPEDLKNLLRQNYLNVGGLLANKYMEKSMDDEMLDLTKLLEHYDPRWGEKYMQFRQSTLHSTKQNRYIIRKMISFWKRLKGKHARSV